MADKRLFTPFQEQKLTEAKQACGTCQAYINALASMGLDMTDREGMNAQRLQTIQRVEAVRDAHDQGQ